MKELLLLFLVATFVFGEDWNWPKYEEPDNVKEGHKDPVQVIEVRSVAPKDVA